LAAIWSSRIEIQALPTRDFTILPVVKKKRMARKKKIVVLRRTRDLHAEEHGGRYVLDADGTARDALPVQRDEPDYLGGTERDDREVYPPEPQGRERYEETDQSREDA
jgi:hypothetical protein